MVASGLAGPVVCGGVTARWTGSLVSFACDVNIARHILSALHFLARFQRRLAGKEPTVPDRMPAGTAGL